MGTIAILLLLFGTNPVPFDKPTVNIDTGYFEINHFWQVSSDPTRKINDKDVYYGSLIFDQLLVWKYNKITNRFEVIHWTMIKDGRRIHRFQTQEDREAENKHVYDKWEWAHIKTAKDNKVPLDAIVIYTASDWLGPLSQVNNPTFNQNTNKYEVIIQLDSESNAYYKFISNTLIETNTDFDPEVTSRTEQGRSGGDVKFTGYHSAYLNKSKIMK